MVYRDDLPHETRATIESGTWIRLNRVPYIERIVSSLQGGDGTMQFSAGKPGPGRSQIVHLTLRCTDPKVWEDFGSLFQSECQAIAKEMRDREKGPGLPRMYRSTERVGGRGHRRKRVE